MLYKGGYVQIAEDEAELDVAAEVEVLQGLIKQRVAAEQKMMKFLKELGYGKGEQ